jgi:hypothetical protein
MSFLKQYECSFFEQYECIDIITNFDYDVIVSLCLTCKKLCDIANSSNFWKSVVEMNLLEDLQH